MRAFVRSRTRAGISPVIHAGMQAAPRDRRILGPESIRWSASDETPRSHPSPPVAAARGVAAVVPLRAGGDGLLSGARVAGNSGRVGRRAALRRCLLRSGPGAGREADLRSRRRLPPVRLVRGRVLRDERSGPDLGSRDSRRLDRNTAACDGARRGGRPRADRSARCTRWAEPAGRTEDRDRSRRFRAPTPRRALHPDHLNCR